jgi:hypothetical protein
LRVSIVSPQAADLMPRPETNHERTLSVPYVFCNHLIGSENFEIPLQRELKDDAL